MREGFFGLNVALRGLYTAQRGLDVVNHNLNNVNTPGYSRQVANQSASKPMPIFDGTGMLGTGSDVTSIDRVRDEYLDFKYWSESIALGEWTAKKTALADMEATFNEPSNSGFTQIMTDFYNALQETAKDPSSLANRALLREKGVTLSKYFNSTAAHFEKLQADLNNQINIKVEEINSIGTQIRQLNRQIYAAELDGNTANDLRDQRGVLVDKLSGLINIEANEVVAGKLPSGKDDTHFVITISGKAFIDHYQLSELDVSKRLVKLNDVDVDHLNTVQWKDGNSLDIRGGELRGLLDIRDGNDGLNGSPVYKGIPYYMKKLNEFVQTFAMSFNEGYSNVQRNSAGVVNAAAVVDGMGHADGFGLGGSTGTRFFTMLGSNGVAMNTSTFLAGATATADIINQYSNITAKNFSIGNDVEYDVRKIALADASGAVGNINTLNKLIAMRHDTKMFAEGGPEDFMKSLITTMGIDSQQAVRISDNQDAIVKQIENRRLSDSGVSIDEEMTNLVKFQHAYSASAKVITTMQEVYDTLINRLGVG